MGYAYFFFQLEHLGCNVFITLLSCRQRCSCPSCHQKRSLVLAYHLNEDVLEEVSHRQYVFTIPKRFRIFFKYDRKLLGKLAKVSWETVREVFVEEIDYEDVYPAMIGGIQTFGDLTNLHPHSYYLALYPPFLNNRHNLFNLNYFIVLHDLFHC